MTDLAVVIAEIDYTARHLGSWMRPRRVGVPLVLQPARARVVLRAGRESCSSSRRGTTPSSCRSRLVVGALRRGQLRRAEALGARF